MIFFLANYKVDFHALFGFSLLRYNHTSKIKSHKRLPEGKKTIEILPSHIEIRISADHNIYF
jgi:hypothetical protein